MARPGKIRTLIKLFDVRYFNGFNSLRSSLGFTRTLFRPGPRTVRLEQIFNYLPISSTLSSSGQPTVAQFTRIAEAGFATVINLAPHGAENALEDEATVVSRLGMRYVHIPVDFKNPAEWDYLRFCFAMKETGTLPVWVHCAANMRVSAFVYRYRIEKLETGREQAAADLARIWTPFGEWKTFIERTGTGTTEFRSGR